MAQRSKITPSTDELDNLSFDAFDEAINSRSDWHDFDAVVEDAISRRGFFRKRDRNGQRCWLECGPNCIDTSLRPCGDKPVWFRSRKRQHERHGCGAQRV